MVVQHNLLAMNANRMLNGTTKSQSKATEKLSSGYRINRAADDAAGLAISEKMRKQIKGLGQASTNAQDGISAVQTTEGALTEVHSMLQRMNELAVQAANGTNSESDRDAIQNEINQLTTEIDRVAETTKFNETYLLKGNGKKATVLVTAKDAGMSGVLTGVGTGTATFKMDALKTGQSITIGSKGYTIGTTLSVVQQTIEDKAGIGSFVTVDGMEYKIANKTDLAASEITVDDLNAIIKDDVTVVIGTQTFHTMLDDKKDGISDNHGSVISAAKAYELVQDELRKASSIGTDPGDEASVEYDKTKAKPYSIGTVTQVTFKINEGHVVQKQGLQLAIHVGADADATNKITMHLDTMTAEGLGIKGLSVVDDTGAKATYAVDAIADAIARVSAQRSELGAIQNRLEHTINNLDNVVENTTSAESEIRDTDMAEEMVEYSKNNILAQAGQAMLTQANQATQGVLSLLQ